jgi:CheY-like chemotaxis protein/HPt (histidine-containing phosphotransfer) domain-containing protein
MAEEKRSVNYNLGLNALVVDDSDINREVIEHILKQAGMNVIAAESGQEGIDIAASHRFDIIFMDNRMPKMSGTEAMKIIKSDNSGKNVLTPVIVITADDDEISKMKFKEEGFDGYLSKPLALDDLMDLIQKIFPELDIEENAYYVNNSRPAGEADNEAEHMPSGYELMYNILSCVSGISKDEGIRACGGKAVFVNVLKGFHDTAPRIMDNIVSNLEKKDMKNYSLYVHTIKSTARLAGAIHLSMEAERLEKMSDAALASENGQGDPDVDYGALLYEIESGTALFLLELRKFMDELDTSFKIIEKNKADQPIMEIDSVMEAYSAIKEYASVFDFISVDRIIDGMNDYRMPESEEERFSRLRILVTELDTEGIGDLLRDAN